MNEPNLTFAPVVERVGWQCGIDLRTITSNDVAVAIGYSPRTVQRWIKRNKINWKYADRVAVNLGWHPCVLWPTEWNDLDE